MHGRGRAQGVFDGWGGIGGGGFRGEAAGDEGEAEKRGGSAFVRHERLSGPSRYRPGTA